MIESDNPLMEPAWHLGPSKFNVWCLVIGIIAAGVTETYRYKMSKKETTKKEMLLRSAPRSRSIDFYMEFTHTF